MISKDHIVKALINCATKQCSRSSCPYYEKLKCYDVLMLDAADSILSLLRDNMDLAGVLEKQKLSSMYGEVHNAEQTDQV